MNAEILFKVAHHRAELEQVHALNHRVFAEEIRQHPLQASGLLVDRYNDQNRYFVAVRRERVVAMVSVNAGPSFSIAKRLPDREVLTSLARPLEVRLLAIESAHRRRAILAGLLCAVYDFAKANDFSDLLISAIASRESMYRKLGFRPLGPAVPDGATCFIPMAKSMIQDAARDSQRVDSYRRCTLSGAHARRTISFLPGPVSTGRSVSEAFAALPVSHRSEGLIQIFERTRSLLRPLVPGAEVVILAGGGTLANDAVAANLRGLFRGSPGLIISNGEFGERLTRHAAGAGLRFGHIRFDWLAPWNFDLIRAALARKPAWVWAVQIETSTGVLNDSELLLSIARDVDCPVALDCISSIGATRIAAQGTGLFFATGVSGKSLGAYAGLALVYMSEGCREQLAGDPVALPATFDLLAACRTPGPMTTIPSSPLCALATALECRYGSEDAIAQRFGHYLALGTLTRRLMKANGIPPLAREEFAAPNVSTFALPNASFPEQCMRAGYQIAHESPYLRERGWGQLATMGDAMPGDVELFFRNFETCLLPIDGESRFLAKGSLSATGGGTVEAQ